MDKCVVAPCRPLPVMFCTVYYSIADGKMVPYRHELQKHGIIQYIHSFRSCTRRCIFQFSHYADRLPQQSIRRLAFVPPYSVFCSTSFRCGGLSIERNQKPLAPEVTLAVTHHDRQKQIEVKRSSRVNPHEIRLFSGCPYAVVKQGTKKFTKK